MLTSDGKEKHRSNNGGRFQKPKLSGLTSSSVATPALIFAACGVALLAIEIAILQEFSVEVSDVVVDEHFHLQQTQRYCEGRWGEWDPAITTPPGTYLFGVAWSASAQTLGLITEAETCSLPLLRSLNVAFHVGAFFLCASILGLLHDGISPRLQALRALVLSLLPTHFFFCFLYYTDVGSTFFVLLMYFFVLKQSKCIVEKRVRTAVAFHLAGASAAAVAVLFRQTNAVWVCFATGQQLAFHARKHIHLSAPSSSSQTPSSHGASPLHSPSLCVDADAPALTASHVGRFLGFLVGAEGRGIVIRHFALHIGVIVAFLACIFMNGGIVLGDKSNHTPGLHLAQIAYFATFTAVFSAGELWHAREDVRRAMTRQSPRQAFYRGFAAFLVVLGALHFGTITHRFLLSDHRHYTFMLWRHFFNRHWICKYIPAPMYVAVLYLLILRLRRIRPIVSLGFSVAALLVLVPSPLVELRYFTVPFIFLKLNLPPARTVGVGQACVWWQYVPSLMLGLAANAIVLFVFLRLPFESSDWGSDTRYMF